MSPFVKVRGIKQSMISALPLARRIVSPTAYRMDQFATMILPDLGKKRNPNLVCFHRIVNEGAKNKMKPLVLKIGMNENDKNVCAQAVVK
jgi:hypothetical protein